MKEPLVNRFIVQIKALTGFNFQDFVGKLFLAKVGPSRIILPRHVHDKGCDGILLDKKAVICAYGPEKNENKKFDSKITPDFNLYKKHWEKEYPGWIVVFNNRPSPDQIKSVQKLKNDAEIIGIDGILEIIETIKGSDRRRLGKHLKIEDEFFSQNYLTEILENLIRQAEEQESSRVSYTNKAVHITEKIKLNFDKDDAEAMEAEYDKALEYFKELEGIIEGYADYQKDVFKTKIVRDFNEDKGTFSQKMQTLINKYSEKYENCEDHSFFIRIILVYFFEQCLIGIKTDKGK